MGELLEDIYFTIIRQLELWSTYLKCSKMDSMENFKFIEEIVSHRRNHWCRKDKYKPDIENETTGQCLFGWRLVRGHASISGDFGNKKDGIGEHKFPGGGMNDGETLEQTLLREVQEEISCVVDISSSSEGFVVSEKRKGDLDNLMIMASHYFYCEVSEVAGNRNLNDYEAEYDYQVSWMTLHDAI